MSTNVAVKPQSSQSSSDGYGFKHVTGSGKRSSGCDIQEDAVCKYYPTKGKLI